jgi:DNA-binding NarL/FixJ family response regulator
MMGTIRVMLVEASDLFLQVTIGFLEQREDLAIVGTARSGREALDQTPQLEPDVILLDLKMPDRSGFEVLTQLRAMLPTAGIIILTLYDFEAYRKVALANGADEFITKDKLFTELPLAIKRVVQMKGCNS